MSEVTRGYWAQVFCNADFMCVETWSGYRGGTHGDHKGKQHLLPPEVDNLALGAAVQDALAHSRWVLGAPREGSVYPIGVEFDMSLYDYKLHGERYAAWITALMQRYGYKTKRALFKGMKKVSIEHKNNVLKFTPSHHSKLELWEGVWEAGDVVIPATSTPAEIGAALRLALIRCTGQ